MPSPHRPNNTAIVVLGMIAAGRRNGYEITQSVDRSTSFFWPASSGGIYSELQRLHSSGLLEQHEDPRGDAKRHTYELTPQGRDALQTWLLDQSPGRMELRHEDLLRLFLAEGSSSGELADLLDRIAEGHEARNRSLETNPRPSADDGPTSRTLALDFGIALNSAAAQWCRDTARTMRAPT